MFLLGAGVSDQDMGWTAEELWCDCWHGEEHPNQLWGPPSFLFSVSGALSLDIKQLGQENDHSSHLMPRLMNGAVPPLLHMHSWCAWAQLLLHSVAYFWNRS